MIRLGAVGDVVRTLPAVSALRAAWPGARLVWLVEPPSAGIVEGQPWVDRVLVFPRPRLAAALRAGRPREAAALLRGFLRDLRGERFELAVDFHSIAKSAILARLSGAPRRVGFARPFGREGSWLLTTERARLAPRRVSRFERNAALVRALGVKAAPAAEPLRVHPASAAELEAALGPVLGALLGPGRGTGRGPGVDAGRAPVVIHPGTSDATPHKRWHVPGYASVARALARDPGVPVLVTAGPARDDRVFADAVVAASGGAAQLAPPTPSLAHLAALFARALLYVGSDTGPMHVASLVGTPVVQILGPTHPLENQPWEGTPSRTVRVPVACSPCRRGCAAATCMRVVPPELVLRAARELLASPEAKG